MPEQLLDRFECYTLIFGLHYAKQFGKSTFKQLRDASLKPDHPLVADMALAQRERLRATLRLAELWYREQNWSPLVLTDMADVVRFIRPATEQLRDRSIWLLALDASGAMTDQVLVQICGDHLKPPPLRDLLRHALFKSAVTIWIADFRPVEQLDVLPQTLAAFTALAEIGAAIGVEVRDWLLFNHDGMVSVRDQVPVQTECGVNRVAA